ncbi:MAG: disulfide bond formation protein B, partial [Alphaproteobacteria bacterium]|nr:disulfide bond formation protein B [Alphaproteobacteria bacterium]
MKLKPPELLYLPRIGLLLLLASAASLTFAFILQFVYGVAPCILCLAQRVPFAFGTILAATLVAARPFGKHSTALLLVIAFVYLVNTGIAIFHTGVEQHWWMGTASCSTQPLAGDNADDLREALLN